MASVLDKLPKINYSSDPEFWLQAEIMKKVTSKLYGRMIHKSRIINLFLDNTAVYVAG